MKFFLSSHRGRDKKFPSLLLHDSLLQSWCQSKLRTIIHTIWNKLHTERFFCFVFTQHDLFYKNLGMVLSFLVCYLPGHYLLTMFRGTCMSFLYNIRLTLIKCGLGGVYTQEMLWGGRGRGIRKPVQVFLSSSRPINKLQPVKGHQLQPCLCMPASSQ